MSPWASKAQAAWGNSSSGQKALGKEAVKEWNAATPKGSLTRRHVMPRKKRK